MRSIDDKPLSLADHLAGCTPDTRKLAARIAHEINNPTAYVLTNLEFLRETVAELTMSLRLDDAQARVMAAAIEDALEGIGRVRNTVRQLGAVPAEDGRAPAPAVSRSAFVPRRRCRVLLIDDETAILRALGRMLRVNHEVLTADRGEVALELFEAGEPIDVIFCDLLLPGLTGMDIYERVQADYPEYADRMVFMTGGAVTPRAARFIKGRSRWTLAKPIDAEVLDRMIIEVTELVRERRSSNGDDLR